MAATTAAAVASVPSKSSSIEFLSRLTLASVTPGTPPAALCTRAEHAAQVIPWMSKVSLNRAHLT